MNLGDKVKFRGCMTKARVLNEFDREALEEFGQSVEIQDIKKRSWYFKETPILEGIICGKRNLYLFWDVEEGFEDNSYGILYGYNMIEVYLIANKLTGFYRVPASWVLGGLE